MAPDKRHSTRHTLLFAALVCAVCSVLVSGSAVLLSGRHRDNLELYRERRILAVAGVSESGPVDEPARVRRLFRQSIRVHTLQLQTGHYVQQAPAGATDPERALSDETLSRPAPANKAGVIRVPLFVRVYQVPRGGQLERVILPVEGKGLWSTLRGYVAIARDGTTLRGITFYEHAETPGLGAEIDDPEWQALWVGRRAFDDAGSVQLRVIKGRAGSPAEDPFRVDGLSGATLTGDGVTRLLEFWLGPHGYGPFLSRLRAQEVAS